MDYAFRTTLTRFLVVLAVLVLFTSTVWAQGGTGELVGLVTDPTGAVVPNVQVNLSNTATGDKRTTSTTQAGLYRFVALPVVGSYTLEASLKGFKSYKIANIIISVGVVTNHDVKLEVGSTSEQVTVEAGAQLVQTTESAISDLVDRRVWQTMPLEQRSQNEFIGLMAGAVPAATADLNIDRGAAVNGTRSGTGNYLVEGFDNNDQGLGGGGSLVGPGGANTTISPDAIQEYRVIEHNFSAEYGKAGGFVTDTVLRSGTNQWHGSLYEYNRVQALAANSFFSNRAGQKDSLVRNQFGGSVGGPVVKDKTFFFFTAEWHRRRQNSPLSANSTTPDFLNFVDSGAFETFMESDPNGFCFQFTGVACPGGFPDAATLGPIFSGTLRNQPFPLCVPGAANCDSASLTNIGQSLYTGGMNYPVPVYGLVTVAQPDKLDQTRYTGKVDHKLSTNDQINGTFLYDNADETIAWAGADTTIGPPLPIHGRAMNAGITWSHTFSPTVLNQFRAAYVRHTGNFPGDPSAGAAGLPSIVTAFDSFAVGFGNASNLPQFFTENQFQYKDDLSVTKGKHNFKGGGEYRRTRNGSSFDAAFNGLFLPYGIEDLVTDMKFSDNADFAYFGYPAYGSWFYAEASVDPTKNPPTRPVYYRGYRANEVGAYIQDDWRIHPRLTLNLGVRWEYFGPPHNFQSGIDSNFYTGVPVTPFLCSGLPCSNPFMPVNNTVIAAVATGTTQVKDHNIWNKDLNNWAPRVGFAWDMFGNQKFVVRGGGGIAYDRMYNNIFENIRFNPPFFCFCNFGTFVNGVPGGGNETPGIYTVPFTSTAEFANPANFPGGALPKATPRAIDQNLVTAYYEQANFGFQYELGKDFVLETNYVGTFGHKLIGIINLNTFPGRSGAGFSSARPNSTLSSINFRANAFSSNYHALQATLRKRFTNGLQFNANYTYAKALDELSDTFGPRAQGTNPQDSMNIPLDYGPADFDIRHRLVGSYSYDLPFFKGNRWIGGWTVSGIFSASSGPPFSVYNSAIDANHNGTFNDRAAFKAGFNSENVIVGAGHPADGYLVQTDPNTGINPAFGTLGVTGEIACPASVNLGLWCEGRSVGQTDRNAIRGPGYIDVDFGVAKRFKITETAGIQFQANFFNLANHPNFRLPDGNLNSGTFGSSTATRDPRITQLALRFDF
jgi:hypothetical protein